MMMGEVGTCWTRRSDLAQDNEQRQDVWVSFVTRTWEQHPDLWPAPTTVTSNLYTSQSREAARYNPPVSLRAVSSLVKFPSVSFWPPNRKFQNLNGLLWGSIQSIMRGKWTDCLLSPLLQTKCNILPTRALISPHKSVNWRRRGWSSCASTSLPSYGRGIKNALLQAGLLQFMEIFSKDWNYILNIVRPVKLP